MAENSTSVTNLKVGCRPVDRFCCGRNLETCVLDEDVLCVICTHSSSFVRYGTTSLTYQSHNLASSTTTTTQSSSTKAGSKDKKIISRKAMLKLFQKVKTLDQTNFYENPVLKAHFAHNPAQGEEYFVIVKEPMCFKLVRTKLDAGGYDGKVGGFAVASIYWRFCFTCRGLVTDIETI